VRRTGLALRRLPGSLAPPLALNGRRAPARVYEWSRRQRGAHCGTNLRGVDRSHVDHPRS
jgi:hypothetical protein